ncbi:hypothetical protein EV182_008141, partial [Spiromyces aspiralis]
QGRPARVQPLKGSANATNSKTKVPSSSLASPIAPSTSAGNSGNENNNRNTNNSNNSSNNDNNNNNNNSNGNNGCGGRAILLEIESENNELYAYTGDQRMCSIPENQGDNVDCILLYDPETK